MKSDAKGCKGTFYTFTKVIETCFRVRIFSVSQGLNYLLSSFVYNMGYNYILNLFMLSINKVLSYEYKIESLRLASSMTGIKTEQILLVGYCLKAN